MTAIEFHRLSNGTGSAQAHGWMVSLLCHMLGLWCAVLMTVEIDKPVLSTPFRWEVAMVEAPPPARPSPAEPAPVPPDPQPVRRMVASQPLVTPPAPVQQTVHGEVREVEAIEPVQQAAREVVTQAETLIERQEAQTVVSQAVIAQAVTPTQETVVARTVSREAIAPRVERVQQADVPALSEAAPQTIVAEPVERVSPSVEAEARTVEHRVVQQRLVRIRQTQADYGWLRDSLWRRIEELKRYPTQAKANHWEGKVVVEAIIRDDGEVVALSIAESSGRAVLDQEAMAVMKKASPLALKHPLGTRTITILVPISYRLDG